VSDENVINEAYAEVSERWKWLESTYKLQRDVYGIDLPMKEGAKLADYATWNSLALVTEVGELTNEIGWKPWIKNRGWANRANAISEAVDVAHFLANILCALDVSDAEWEDAYQKKQEINRQRQQDGYDGITGKCPDCKRSYDDGIKCTPAEEIPLVNVSGSQCVTHVTAAWCAYA